MIVCHRGTPAEPIPLLLPVGSMLASRQGEDDDTMEANGVTGTRKQTTCQAALLAKFVRGIPKPAAFAVAWGIYSNVVQELRQPRLGYNWGPQTG